MNSSKRAEQIAFCIKLRKRLTVAAFALAVTATLILLGDYHYYNGLEVRGVGLGLHPIIIFAVLFAEGIAAVIVYSRAESIAERILNDECDPQLYCDVKRTLLSRVSYVSAISIIDLTTSYYRGDFASCRNFAGDAVHAPGDPDKLFGYSFLGMSAYFLGDRKALEDALVKSKRILEGAKIDDRSPLRADFARRIRVLEMLAADGTDREKAVQYANSLGTLPERTTAIERLNTEYLRALVYENAGEKDRAGSCLDVCRGIKGKTFINEALLKNDQKDT